MNTLIELFDECQSENIIGALHLKPARVVFVGFKETMNFQRVNAIKEFFRNRENAPLLEFEVVGRYNIDSVEEHISFIAEKYPDCCFDITGGKEAILAAMGKVAAEKEIPIIQYDIKKCALVLRDNVKFEIPSMDDVGITIEELVGLNGGVVAGAMNNWNMDFDFVKDIESAWSIARESCGSWNSQITALGNFEKYGKTDASSCITMRLSGRNKDYVTDDDVIEPLLRNGLLTGYEVKDGKVTFSCKNDNVKKLLTKSGNVLELYAYMLIKEIGKGISDMATGVVVDWDGKIGKISDVETRNEIDIMLTKGLMPVFISCKNGEVNKEALYELDSIADKFGGEYAKKVILATYLSGNEEKREYLKMRAKDMGIRLICGIEEMTREEFKAELEKIIR